MAWACLLASVVRAARCLTYPRRVTASRTCCRAVGLTLAELLRTREAVAGETPANAATSASVGASRFVLVSMAGTLSSIMPLKA